LSKVSNNERKKVGALFEISSNFTNKMMTAKSPTHTPDAPMKQMAEGAFDREGERESESGVTVAVDSLLTVSVQPDFKDSFKTTQDKDSKQRESSFWLSLYSSSSSPFNSNLVSDSSRQNITSLHCTVNVAKSLSQPESTEFICKTEPNMEDILSLNYNKSSSSLHLGVPGLQPAHQTVNLKAPKTCIRVNSKPREHVMYFILYKLMHYILKLFCLFLLDYIHKHVSTRKSDSFRNIRRLFESN
jgi:hypothetical protein